MPSSKRVRRNAQELFGVFDLELTPEQIAISGLMLQLDRVVEALGRVADRIEDTQP